MAYLRVLLCMVLSIPRSPLARAQVEATGARKVINRVVPQYPQLARSLRIEGTVKLLAVVAPNGKPTSTRVMGGHPVFAKAAVDAVEKWKWTPAPEETREVLEMHFRPEWDLALRCAS
jgi:TonB family protein